MKISKHMTHDINCPKGRTCAVVHTDGVCPDSLLPCTCKPTQGTSNYIYNSAPLNNTEYDRGYNAGFVDGVKKASEWKI